ncbi:MAG: DUF5906 domain-containing protein [Candidatus Odinarchaeota archaeon]
MVENSIDRQELYNRYEEECRKPALYSRKDKKYETKSFQLWEKQQNTNLPINQSQIERYIANYIVNNNQIITFRETDELCKYNGGVFHRNNVSKAEIREQINSIVKNKFKDYKESLSTRNMVFEYIKNNTFCSMEHFGLDEDIINLKNGILTFDNKTFKYKFIPHKKYGKTLHTFIQFPVNFKIDAKCPTIEKILLDIFGQDQLTDIYEFIAYTLFPTIRYDKALILHGAEDTGETTFINIITQLLGEKNISQVEMYRLYKRFQVANLRNKAANINDDLADLPLSYAACGWIKKLVTNKYLEGELKGIQGNAQWRNRCKLICACNRLPEPEDKSDAFFKRWIGVSCFNQFKGKNKDTDLKHKTWSDEELSGLLNKCLIAWKRLNKRGGFRRKWQDTEYVKSWWMQNINPIVGFINRNCVTGNSDSHYIDCKEFRDNLNSERRKLKLEELSQNYITRELKNFDERIVKRQVNKEFNPESSGYKYIYIRWSEGSPYNKDMIEFEREVYRDVNGSDLDFKQLENGEYVDSSRIFEHKKNNNSKIIIEDVDDFDEYDL